MIKRNNFAPNHISMLDLLSSALAAVIILFVMIPQEEGGASEKAAQELSLEDDGAESGQRFILRNIHFHGGTSELLPDSRTHLKEVAEYFLRNDHLNFTIEGHANNLYSDADEDSLVELSSDRAQKVFRVFLSLGVARERMQYVGKGSSEMIITDEDISITEASYENTAINRRVEILID